jgi:DNA-binding response OmpR family regulator
MPERILVVEDEVDFTTTYERLLRRQGYEVTSVGSRREALRRVETDQPRLVIVDLRLPDGTGLDVIRAARSLPTPAPVIVVTGFTSRDNRQAAREAGASAFLAKPFTAAEFATLVRRVIGEA